MKDFSSPICSQILQPNSGIPFEGYQCKGVVFGGQVYSLKKNLLSSTLAATSLHMLNWWFSFYKKNANVQYGVSQHLAYTLSLSDDIQLWYFGRREGVYNQAMSISVKLNATR